MAKCYTEQLCKTVGQRGTEGKVFRGENSRTVDECWRLGGFWGKHRRQKWGGFPGIERNTSEGGSPKRREGS